MSYNYCLSSEIVVLRKPLNHMLGLELLVWASPRRYRVRTVQWKTLGSWRILARVTCRHMVHTPTHHAPPAIGWELNRNVFVDAWRHVSCCGRAVLSGPGVPLVEIAWREPALSWYPADTRTQDTCLSKQPTSTTELPGARGKRQLQLAYTRTSPIFSKIANPLPTTPWSLLCITKRYYSAALKGNSRFPFLNLKENCSLSAYHVR